MTRARRSGFHRAGPLGLALLLLVGVAPRAQAADDDYLRYFNAMVRLYESLEYERALEQLERARKHSRGADDDISLALYEGTLRSDLGQAEQARAAFKTALLLRPDVTLPVRVSPKVRREFEDLRRDVKRELAPLLEKQRLEEEKRKQAEDAKKAEEEKKTLEAKRADEARRAEEARRQAEVLRLEALKRTEEQRRLELEQARSPDAPRRASLTPTEPPLALERPAAAPGKRGFPAVPVVFLALGAAAGGVATGFGIDSSKSVGLARQATWQDETLTHLANAQTSATVANVALGTAAVLGAATLVGFIVWGVSPVEPESAGAAR